MKRKVLFGAIVGVVVLGGIALYVWNSLVSGAKQNIEERAEEYMADYQSANKNTKLVNDEQITERNPYEEKHDDTVTYPEDTITYMFTAAKANDVEGFYNSFTADTLYKSFPDPAKMRDQMNEYLQFILQDGKLKDIGLLSKKVTNPDPMAMKVMVSVALHYDGLSRKEISIEVERFGDQHGSSVWLVITPITEIINQIR
ncbi:hypothetical protein POF51_25940 [Brevibacillus sp. AG]|uniref:hypothetical protein n=1 Tax=Brevibacillus sp. AG TaxID=3020891 RepID=UPI00232BD8BB|nr:hypothetical protein [Brevibacillus sp. AG]MDC0764165.1 hypothetical protein [Brevibacillus sp. AG]